MAGYHGFVQSIIRRGSDAYQVTLGIYPEHTENSADSPQTGRPADQLLVYRADIAVDDDRTIVFPDRELSRCIDAYRDSAEANLAGDIAQREKTVGEIAAGICSEVGELLLRRNSVRAF